MRRSIAFVGAALLVLSVAGTALADGIEIKGDCAKFDSDVIGMDVAVTLDGVTITLHDWVEKDGEPDEYVGFSFTIAGGSFDDITVKAGRGYFDVDPDGGAWVNPNGTGGRYAKAISNIVVCGADGDGGGGPIVG